MGGGVLLWGLFRRKKRSGFQQSPRVNAGYAAGGAVNSIRGGDNRDLRPPGVRSDGAGRPPGATRRSCSRPDLHHWRFRGIIVQTQMGSAPVVVREIGYPELPKVMDQWPERDKFCWPEWSICHFLMAMA